MNKLSGKTKKAVAAAITGYCFYGMSFMFSRIALNTVPVIVLLSHRFLLAYLIMTVLRFTPLVETHLTGKKQVSLYLLGILQPVAYFLAEQYGILNSSSSFSGVMIALIPIVAALAAVPVLHEKLSLRQLFFSLLSFGGVAGIGLITGRGGSLNWIGVVCLMTAVLSAVASDILNRHYSANFTAFERAYFMLGFGAVTFTVMAAVSVRKDPSAYFQPLADMQYLMCLLYLSVGCSVIAFFLLNYVISIFPVARAAVFGNLSTAVSVFAGTVFLKEPSSFALIPLVAMILLGIYGTMRCFRNKQEPGKEDGKTEG